MSNSLEVMESRLGRWSLMKMKNSSPDNINKRIERIVLSKEVPEKLRWKVLVQEALKVVETVPYPYIPRAPRRQRDNHQQNPCETSPISSSQILDDVKDVEGHVTNIFQCPDYAGDIYNYFREAENGVVVKEGFMRHQTYVTVRMRKILINWLVEVQIKYKLLNETLFLTVSLIDRFLEQEIVHAVEFQLVGITALLIASKFEEPLPQRISELVHVTDDSYSKNEVLRMEKRMLKALKFSVGCPLIVHFLRRFCQTSRIGAKAYAACKYVAELSMLDAKIVRYPPSMVAAASFYLANVALSPKFNWDVSLVNYSGYDVADLAPVVRILTESVRGLDATKYPALRKKYSSRNNFRVSVLPEIESMATRCQ